MTLPGSKSLTNRALVLAAIADGPSVVRRALRSRDTDADGGRAAPRSASTVDTAGDDWTVTPAPFAGDADGRLRPGRHGDAVRAAGRRAVHRAGRLRRRPAHAEPADRRGAGRAAHARASRSTTTAAARCRSRCTARARSAAARSSSTRRRPRSSSPALLLAGARYEQGVDVRHDGKPVPSLPHIEMTVAMLREHGVEVDDADANRWAVAPGPVQRARPRRSSRTCPTPRRSSPWPPSRGGAVTVRDWPRATTQAGDALREILGRDGLRGRPRRTTGCGSRGTGAIHGVDLDLHDVGELTPAVAALCALAESPSHLRGIAHIRGHETDRLAALADRARRPGRRRHRARRRAVDPAGPRCTAGCSTPTPTTGWRTPA